MKLLDKATNMFGPIGEEAKDRIRRYLDAPTVEGWDDIHSLVVHASTHAGTIWQAVIAIDPSYRDITVPYHYKVGAGEPPAKKRWKRFPDAVTVARAIKHVLTNPIPKVAR